MTYDSPLTLHVTTPTLHDTPHPNLYIVQPTSDTPKSRNFPSLSYSKDNLRFINKFNFQFPDLTDTEYITLCNLLVKHERNTFQNTFKTKCLTSYSKSL